MLLIKQTLVQKMYMSENKGNGKYPKFSFVRNIRYAKLIILVKKGGVRKHRVITVLVVTFHQKIEMFAK